MQNRSKIKLVYVYILMINQKAGNGRKDYFKLGKDKNKGEEVK